MILRRLSSLLLVPLLAAQTYQPAEHTYVNTSLPVVCQAGATGFVQTNQSTSGNTPVFSCTAIFSNPVTTGHTMFFLVWAWNGTLSTVTDSQGNSYSLVSSNYSTAFSPSVYARWELFRADHITGASTLNINGNRTDFVPGCAAFEYTGLITTQDAASLNTAFTAVTSFPLSPVATTAVNDTLISFFLWGNGAASVPAAGYTLDYSGAVLSEASCLSGGVGSYGGTWTTGAPSTANNGWTTILVAMKH